MKSSVRKRPVLNHRQHQALDIVLRCGGARRFWPLLNAIGDGRYTAITVKSLVDAGFLEYRLRFEPRRRDAVLFVALTNVGWEHLVHFPFNRGGRVH